MLIIKYSSEIIDKTRNSYRKITDFIINETDTLIFVFANPDINILSFEKFRLKYFPNYKPN
jgi:hypothetical protein